jgi:hypothetical protein
MSVIMVVLMDLTVNTMAILGAMFAISMASTAEMGAI